MTTDKDRLTAQEAKGLRTAKELEGQKVDYFIHAAGVLLSRKKGKVLSVNHYAPLALFKSIFKNLTGTALFIGAAAEDVNVPEIHQLSVLCRVCGFVVCLSLRKQTSGG